MTLKITKISGRDSEGKIFTYASDDVYSPEELQSSIDAVREVRPDAKPILALLENKEN